MAVKIEKLTREFSYNGLMLPDPGPQMSPEDVRNIYCAAYPEITSAAVEGPERKGDKLLYVFKRGAGTKGSSLDFSFKEVDGLNFIRVEPVGTAGPLLKRFVKALRLKLANLGEEIDKYLFV